MITIFIIVAFLALVLGVLPWLSSQEEIDDSQFDQWKIKLKQWEKHN
jgi:hypothetical protein